MSEQAPVVTIVYKSVPQYRRQFYEDLRIYLAERGVQLRLVYGQPTASEALRGDSVQIAWGVKTRNTFIQVGSRQLVWQSVLSELQGSSLVIVEQANKLLVNYVLLVLNVLRLQRLAFWGHGRDFQSPNRNSISERAKRLFSKHVFWWFAYNQTSVDVVTAFGYPANRITLVQNSIDTTGLIHAKAQITPTIALQARRSLGISDSARLCVFVGGMYPEKRLEYLVEACDYAHGALDSFEMLFVGAGPSSTIVTAACKLRPWMHYDGPQFGESKALMISLSELVLLPDLVGLAVVDSFALEVPLVTIESPFHGPEIEYLVDGVNGVVVSDAEDPRVYGDRIVSVLLNEPLLADLKLGCRQSASQYTMASMVENFGQGVLAALNARW